MAKEARLQDLRDGAQQCESVMNQQREGRHDSRTPGLQDLRDCAQERVSDESAEEREA